jgi:hypothetical protein
MSAKWKKYKRPRNERVGNLFFTLGIICFIIGMLPILSVIGTVMYYLIIFVIIVATLGLILLNKDFKNSLSSGEQVFKNIAQLMQYAPYVLGVGALFSLTATIIYAKSKTLRRKGGNVAAGVIFTIIPIIVAIFIIKLDISV